MGQSHPDIVWVDDQYYRLVPIIQPLLDTGFNVYGIESYAEALKVIDMVRKSKLLIMDLIIKPGDISIDLKQHPYLGLDLLEQFEAADVHVPTVVFTVVREEALLARARHVRDVFHVVKKGEKDREFVKLTREVLTKKRMQSSKRG